jgi:hypothetical protein
MTHPRTQIRQAVVEHLRDATDAEERVFTGRIMPLAEPDLPAIIIHTRDPETIISRSVSGWNGFEQRRCIVSVVCITQPFDDIDAELDALSAQVEAALQAWIIPGFESSDVLLLETSTTDPEFDGSLTTAATTLRYAITYRTPYRDCSNPYVQEDPDTINQSGAYPGGQVVAGCPATSTGEVCPIGEAELFSQEGPIN